MKLLFKLAALVIYMTQCSSLINGFVADQSAPDAKRIVEKAQEVVKIDSAEFVSQLIIFDAKGRKRIRRMAQVSKLFDNGRTEKRLIRFLAPADVKGVGLLSFDYENKTDDMWFYMPALRKARRIVSSEKSKNFMGSEFTYGDITSLKIDSFNYRFLGEERVEAGRDGQRLVRGEHENLGLVLQPAIAQGYDEHRTIRSKVVAVGRTLAIVPVVAGLDRQHGGLGVGRAPLAPRRGDDG